MGKIDELTNEASAMQKPVSDIAERGGSGAIAQLIQQYCPDGVEYKPLGKVCLMERGTSATKGTMQSGEIPVISGGRQPAFYCNHSNRTGETITIAGSGAGAGYVQYWNEPIFVCDAFSIKGNDGLMTKYTYYYLSSIQEQIYSTKKGGGVPHVHISSIDKFEIPLPPLPVQEAIVNILDRFAVYAAELQAELQARQQQYNYYRDTLLSFEGREDVQWKKLGEVCVFIKDGTHGSYKNVEQGYPLLSAKDINNGIISIPIDCRRISDEDYKAIYKNYKLIQGDVLITIVGSIGRTAIVRDDLEVAFQRSVGILRPKNEVLSSYLSYILRTSTSQNQLVARTNKSAQGGIYLGELSKIEIPIPSLSEQQRIVDILDRFDTLVNDLSQGLPAEIEARQQQYEYYRDKLLTFKKKEA